MRGWWLAWMVAAAGCAGSGVIDVDGDGVVSSDDCDDANPAVRPGAAERCNGVDDDCDQAVDEGLEGALFADVDGDGHGDPETPLAACLPASGAVALADDCDDTRGDVHPGAPEWCDAVDNDCDGTMDGAGAFGASAWFADGDGDGFGDPSEAVYACFAPTGHVSDDRDCDDGDAGVKPGAVEVCDAADNDCDGVTDGASATDRTSWRRDADGDGYGNLVGADVLACEAPAGFVASTNDCDDARAAVNPGASEACDGLDNDCDAAVDESSGVGARVAYEDADGDGYGSSWELGSFCPTALPEGGAWRSGDCDDFAAASSPESVWYVDADYDGYGVKGTAKVDCSPGYGWSSVVGDCNDARGEASPAQPEQCPAYEGDPAAGDDDCDGVADEGCLVSHCGPITSDTTWAAGAEHTVSCFVGIQNGATLTIEDGAVVRFGPYSGIIVGQYGPGYLLVDGSEVGVTLTADSGSPAPGDWSGVVVESGGEALLYGVDIEYAGGVASAAVAVEGGTLDFNGGSIRYASTHAIRASLDSTPGVVRIVGATVADNAGYGLWCDGPCLAENGDIAESTFTANADAPLRLPAASVGFVGDGNTFTGNGTDVVEVVAGTVAADAYWRALDADYLMLGTVDVRDPGARPVLVIEDGATLRFAFGAALTVGYSGGGDLVVDGVDLGVLFTADNPWPGMWHGLRIGTGSSATTRIEGLTLEYAGLGKSDGGIHIEGQAAVYNSVVRSNDGHGVYVSGAATLEGVQISANNGAGVRATAAAKRVFLADSEVTGNQNPAITLPAGRVGDLEPGNLISGNLGNFITVVGSSVSTDSTWANHGVPYLVSGTVSVGGVDAPVLTLAPGVVTLWAAGASLSVGSAQPGDLVVAGSAEAPVTFGSQSGAGPGQWLGIRLNDYTSPATELSWFILDDAGSSDGALVLSYAEASIDHGTITHARYSGLRATQSRFSMTDTSISGTATSNAGSRPDGDGVYLGDGVRIDAWSGNTITGGARYPMNLPAGAMVDLDPGTATANVYTGNYSNVLYVRGAFEGFASRGGRWVNPGVPWRITGDVYVACEGVPCEAPVIRVEGGEFRFTTGVRLYVGTAGFGDLIADGATFTSSRSSPLPGDWGGLVFGYRSGPLSSVQNSTIAYGGGTSPSANLYLDQTYGVFVNNTIRDSSGYGIDRQTAPGATIAPNTFSSNGAGDVRN